VNETETIDFIKHNVIMRQFEMPQHKLHTMAGLVCIVDSQSGKVVFIPSPMFYDYVEINNADV
jgi:hypothetical protein